MECVVEWAKHHIMACCFNLNKTPELIGLAFYSWLTLALIKDHLCPLAFPFACKCAWQTRTQAGSVNSAVWEWRAKRLGLFTCRWSVISMLRLITFTALTRVCAHSMCVFLLWVSRSRSHAVLLTGITSHHEKHTVLHQESHSQSKVSTRVSHVRANWDKCGPSRHTVVCTCFKIITIKIKLYSCSTFQYLVKCFTLGEKYKDMTDAEGKNIRNQVKREKDLIADTKY